MYHPFSQRLLITSFRHLQNFDENYIKCVAPFQILVVFRFLCFPDFKIAAEWSCGAVTKIGCIFHALFLKCVKLCFKVNNSLLYSYLGNTEKELPIHLYTVQEKHLKQLGIKDNVQGGPQLQAKLVENWSPSPTLLRDEQEGHLPRGLLREYCFFNSTNIWLINLFCYHLMLM